MLKGLLAEPEVFTDFSDLAGWSKIFQNCAGVSIFLGLIKIFKYISFNKTMSILSGTLTRVGQIPIQLKIHGLFWKLCMQITSIIKVCMITLIEFFRVYQILEPSQSCSLSNSSLLPNLHISFLEHIWSNIALWRLVFTPNFVWFLVTLISQLWEELMHS